MKCKSCDNKCHCNPPNGEHFCLHVGSVVKNRVDPTYPAEALEALVGLGLFHKQADGWCYAIKSPAPENLDFFVDMVSRLGRYSIGGRYHYVETSAFEEMGTRTMFRILA